MIILSRSLLTVGFVLVVVGIVAVFKFDQPSELFSLIWWMIVGGWCLAVIGMGIDIIHVFMLTKYKVSYGVRSPGNTARSVQREPT